MSPLVSCIIPAFNAAPYVREAIDSVLVQSYRPLEVIVVDDGSTDETGAVVRGIGPDVRYIHQENAGPSVARNHGVSLARGEFVAFLDADDVWHPEKLERQVEHLAACPGAECSLTHVRQFRDDDPREARGQGTSPVVADGARFAGSTMLMRRRVFDAVGLFDPTLRHAGIVDWFERAEALGVRTVVLPEVLMWRRVHATNMSRTGQAESHDEMLRLLKRRLDRRRSALRTA